MYSYVASLIRFPYELNRERKVNWNAKKQNRIKPTILIQLGNKSLAKRGQNSTGRGFTLIKISSLMNLPQRYSLIRCRLLLIIVIGAALLNIIYNDRYNPSGVH